MAVRILYFCSQILCYSILFYFYYSAKHSKEMTMITMPPEEGESEPTKITIAEHDTIECQNQVYRQFFGALMTLFLHYKWGFIPPLLFQSILNPATLYSTPLCRIYLRKERAWGSLKRPWKDAAPSFSKTMAKFESMGETWENAMSGKPYIKRNNKEKKSGNSKKKKRQ